MAQDSKDNSGFALPNPDAAKTTPPADPAAATTTETVGDVPALPSAADTSSRDLLVGGVLAVLGGGALFAVLATRSKRYPVHVDGALRHVVIQPFKSVVVRDTEGEVVGELRRGLGKPVVARVADGHTLRLA